jgi:hypothetical protein
MKHDARAASRPASGLFSTTWTVVTGWLFAYGGRG